MVLIREIPVLCSKKGVAVMKNISIPVGISDFAKIREDGYYYIDKSGLITNILNAGAEVQK